MEKRDRSLKSKIQNRMMQAWKQRVKQLKKETFAIYLACKDSRVPWYAKVLAACVVAYAFSPIDLIPDVIPILGYLDDLVLVPLGIILVIKMIPLHVMAEYREKAETALTEGEVKPKNWVAAVVILLIWVFLGILAFIWIAKR